MCLRVDGQSNRAQRHHLCTGYAGVFLKEHLDPGWRVVSVGGGDVGGGLLPPAENTSQRLANLRSRRKCAYGRESIRRQEVNKRQKTRQGVGHLAYDKMMFVTCLGVIGHLALLICMISIYAWRE